MRSLITVLRCQISPSAFFGVFLMDLLFFSFVVWPVFPLLCCAVILRGQVLRAKTLRHRHEFFPSGRISGPCNSLVFFPGVGITQWSFPFAAVEMPQAWICLKDSVVLSLFMVGL